MPQKLTTTVCFIQEESSGSKRGGVVIKIACIPFFV